MWEVIIDNIRWQEVNNCTSFRDGDKWRVKLYWKVYDKEFKTERDAEVWLLNYYIERKRKRLLKKTNGKRI